MGEQTHHIRVFLADTSADIEPQRMFLWRILKKAGMDVFVCESSSSSLAQMKVSDCSIHIIGKHYGSADSETEKQALVESQFLEAQQVRQNNDSFKIFVWQPWSDVDNVDKRQQAFLATVRNSILQNMIYSKQDSPVLFVEDLRSMMQQEHVNQLNTTSTDIFLIHNELDEESGKEIGSLLSDVLKVERLSLQMIAGMNNADFVVQQIQQSKMAVVYFEKTIDWAIPFVQQIWRKIGGASSLVDILLVGEADVAANKNFIFDAPKVHALEVAKEMIPLEIKVQFDNLTES